MSDPEEGPENEPGVQRVWNSVLDSEQCSSLAWALAFKKIRQGEGLRESLAWAIRNGAQLPNDPESRAWFADALEGKLDAERDRGRPKKPERWDMIRAAIERGIAEAYAYWFAAFRGDRELAWLRAEGQRLWQKQPDAAVSRRIYDLSTEEGRQFYVEALTELGARPCPQADLGAETPHDLALKATAAEYDERWRDVAGKPLKPPGVARLVTKERKAVEHDVSKRYSEFLSDFQSRTPSVTYQTPPRTDFATDDGWQSYVEALTELGAKTPHTLALKVTAAEYGRRWAALEGDPLTPAVVAQVAGSGGRRKGGGDQLRTRAKKSE